MECILVIPSYHSQIMLYTTLFVQCQQQAINLPIQITFTQYCPDINQWFPPLLETSETFEKNNKLLSKHHSFETPVLLLSYHSLLYQQYTFPTEQTEPKLQQHMIEQITKFGELVATHNLESWCCR